VVVVIIEQTTTKHCTCFVFLVCIHGPVSISISKSIWSTMSTLKNIHSCDGCDCCDGS